MPEGKYPWKLYLWYCQAMNLKWDSVGLIRENFPSLGEMLPIYDYLKDIKTSQIIAYSMQKETNPFLEDLENKKYLLQKRVAFFIIAGTGQDTLYNIQIKENKENNGLWRDGIPDPSEPPLDSKNGDGTVIEKSATGNNNLTDEVVVVEGKHSKLTELAQKTIFSQLGIYPKYPLTFKLLHYFLLTGYGPVKIEIEDDKGRLARADINNIENSNYFEAGDKGKNRLAYFDYPIEDNDSGKFKIHLTGTGNGKFKIALWGTQNDFSNEISEEISEGNEISFEVDYNTIQEDSVISIGNIKWSNLLNIISPENQKSYLNWQYLKTGVSIANQSFPYEDSDFKYFIDDDPAASVINLGKLSLGEHNFKVVLGSDFALEEEKTIKFKVDTSLKSLITLIDSFYNDDEIRDWNTRTALINFASFAYQENSNDREGEAKIILREARNILDAIEDKDISSEARKTLKESFSSLIQNPR